MFWEGHADLWASGPLGPGKILAFLQPLLRLSMVFPVLSSSRQSVGRDSPGVAQLLSGRPGPRTQVWPGGHRLPTAAHRAGARTCQNKVQAGPHWEWWCFTWTCRTYSRDDGGDSDSSSRHFLGLGVPAICLTSSRALTHPASCLPMRWARQYPHFPGERGSASVTCPQGLTSSPAPPPSRVAPPGSAGLCLGRAVL